MSHSVLAPSAAYRWLNCTAAPRLEEHVEDQGSPFALEGTLAHAMGARALKTILGKDRSQEETEIAELYEAYHTGEMDEHVESYKNIVIEKYIAAQAVVRDTQLLVETRLDLAKYIPDAHGTADAIIISDDVMEIIDLKYGKGVQVSAFENPQMMIYALGALDLFDDEYNICSVRMTIVQPRLDNLSEYEVPVITLRNWACATLMPKAREAWQGKGVQKPGKWCQFCKVKSNCRALADTCKGAAMEDPKLLSNEELATQILPLLPTIKTWLTGVEDYALAQALSGATLPGYKLVRGRSVRKITDVEGAAQAMLAAGFSDVWKPSELRTLTELEKMIGKKQFATICGEYIAKPEGKPALAPEEDKRPAIDMIAEDFADIKID